ncbi:uncharacterized protein BXZ73DRAFT_54704 [Epithele typhae]|uniref:uncharacterized protein n=1 Tax=Epithele typhae TaxID=378194 RepID=UPI0020075E88|nr:uncharacterized protein BXZ73DRAFT_54704 [Epithele typhae]KAH9914770.1 hypothetical protein BXZ73DRAFT_54704 [Epithele typhae]
MQHQPFYPLGPLAYDPATFPPASLPVPAPVQLQDPHAPEVFKANIQLAQVLVSRVHALARAALTGVALAYHPGTNPLQTAADIQNLKQTLAALVTLLRDSGVGGLPLDPSSAAATEQEKAVIEEGRIVQNLYERLGRMQSGAGVVVDLLAFQGSTGPRTTQAPMTAPTPSQK